MKREYAFPLCIQLTPPKDLYDNTDFNATLSLLKEYGFYGVELNITDFEGIKPDELISYLSEFDLKLTMIATGVYANQNGLSLSSTDEDIRKISVNHMDKILDFAQKTNAGIICGFIKGGPNQNRTAAESQMELSLKEISRLENIKNSDLYLEATNHYEATLVNTVAEGVCFASKADNCIKVLPDTYHMNIEEVNMPATIVKHIKYYDNIHISDNNRYFPGLGAIDFFPIFSLLKSLDYRGTMAIEGRCLRTLNEDIAASAEYIYSVSRRL